MKYPFVVYFTKVEEHEFWVAKCESLKGCVGQGDTCEEAIRELELNEDEWLKTAEEFGIPIPEIPIIQETEYSGKLTLRVSPYVHRIAAEMAKKQGISLNQYINDAVVSQNATLSTADYIVPRVKDAVNKITSAFGTTFIKFSSSQNYKATRIEPTTQLYSYAN